MRNGDGSSNALLILSVGAVFNYSPSDRALLTNRPKSGSQCRCYWNDSECSDDQTSFTNLEPPAATDRRD